MRSTRRYDRERLVELLRKANTLPEDFNAHAKIKRLLKQRLEVIDGVRGVDWAVAEQAAFATLMADGYSVRLSGQDSGRGTFSHRHAVITDVETSAEYFPAASTLASKPTFHAIDSSLSELACWASRWAIRIDTPDALVLWEAQFGDFVNGAQIIIDQYLTASEQKWGRYCGLVLLLAPRLRRAGPGALVGPSGAVPPGLRRRQHAGGQLHHPGELPPPAPPADAPRVRAPLMVMTPKSLLRHPKPSPRSTELASGSFQPVIADNRVTGKAPPGRVL